MRRSVFDPPFHMPISAPASSIPPESTAFDRPPPRKLFSGPRAAFFVLAVAIGFSVFIPMAHAAPGDLDLLDPALVGNYVLATAVQPDGKLILAGKFTSVLGVGRNNIARLNADGTLDATFNPNADGDVACVTVQPDGKLLIAGDFTTILGTSRNRIARLNADGTLDTGFNPNSNGNIRAVALQADGKVLLGGDYTSLQPNGAASPTTRNRIARVNADGTLDTGFDPNTNGIEANGAVSSIAVHADGKIVLSGYFLSLQPNGAASATTRNRIARVNADGSLDTGFNPNANAVVQSLAIQADGKVLMGGDFTSVAGTARNRIARLNADGTLDTGFNPNAGNSVLGIAVQADGKVLLGGYFTALQPNGAASATARNCVARVNADGTLDTTFDPNPNNPLFGLGLQADGKVVMGGFFTTLQPNGAGSPTSRNLFARVVNDAAISTVSVPSSSQVLWTRSGSAPEVSRVTFELSTNSGATWSALGNGTRVGTTSNWQLTGLSLPASGVVRARGATTHGYFNGSSGLVESSVSFPAPPSDPVAWLKAEGNATDATSYGNNGVVNGTVPYVAGKVGNAFSFTGNGANSVRIPNSASLQSSLLTVEYWIYFNNAQNSINVTKRSSSGAGDAWQTGIAYSGGNFILQFVGSTAGGLFDWYSAPLASPVGTWTHVAATYDGTTVKGYVNGSQVLTQAVALNLSTRNADIYFGAYANGTSPLDGKVDELSIYNRALSATEVQAIYQAGATGKTGPAPTVTSVSPASGTTVGGTNVTITGTNFTGATGVTIGGASATNVSVVSATSITATTPAGTAGTASVIVTTPGGSNAANSLFTFVTPPPTVTAISPSSGTTLGGTNVTITGTNFTGATGVAIGGAVATNVSVVNSTSITATTPAGTAGTASVIVTTPGGSNAANSLYTYLTPPPSDPVAWLKAEGNATDATSFGNNGVVNGTVPYVPGKVGNAFSFTGNGANSVRIPNSASLQSNLITVEYWVYLNNVHTAITVTKRSVGGAGDAWQSAIINAGGSLQLQFMAYTSGGSFVDWYSPAQTYPVGVWTHVATTYDGSTVKGYINGIQVLTQTVALQLGSRTSDVYLGAGADGSVPLNGNVDELSIYNRALSATEVQAIYQAGPAGKTSAVPAPTVASISPTSGSTLGGTSVTITGTNFTGATGVTFGGTAATGVTVVNATTITATTPAKAAGTASVVVTTPSGSNAANTLFTYAAPVPPSVTGVSPSSGSTSGGTSVTITGTNFIGATGVTFGGTAATGVTVVNATTITATTPAKAAGTASVVVTTPSGSNAANTLFTYAAPVPPSVTGVSPSSGSTSGGTSVTITGTNFIGATGVTFGGTAATGVTVVNATTITATTPAKAAGTASVVVTTPGGSNTANTLYTYVTPAPTVASISPNSGSTAGGTSVTITGTNFTGATAVTFGGNAATNVTVVNSTTITATTPAGTAGTASVIVTTPGGSNAANSLYTYISPVVTASFTNASTVPISAASYTASGRTLNLTLGFAPATGTTLTIVNNTGLGFISGTFANLAQGQTVALSFGGVTYPFVANYYGGTGNDLVLVWANTRAAVWGGPQSRVPTNLPTDGVLSGKTVIALAAGAQHHLALCSDGTLAAWGINSWGQLGDSTFTHSVTTPVAVTTTGALAGKTVIAVSAGFAHSLALCSDGTVVAWGANDSGQLGNSSVSYSNAPIAVTTSGALAGKTVAAISAGSMHNLALCSDGTIVAWGSNGGGVLGDSTLVNRNVPVAVKTTGILAGKTVVAISAGRSHSIALCSDGTLTIWGDNQYGQLGNTSFTYSPEPIGVDTNGVLSGRTVTAITAGGLHSVVLCSDGTLAAWGLNDEGRVGDNSTTRRDLPVAVTTGGALTGKTIASLSSGDIHTLALCTDGTLIVWGGNYNRQLGDGTTNHSLVPIALTGDMPPGGGRFVGAKSGSVSSSSLALIAAGAPRVTAVSPFSGVTTGGTSVTLTGTDFIGATGVTFGGTTATNVTVVNDTTLTATTPAGSAGAVNVVVTTPRGSNPANTLYTYVLPEVVANPPTVTGVSPASGSTYGGTSVTISGTDFTNATALTFGGTAAANFSVVNDTTITAITPVHAAGAVSVVVTTPAGGNTANSAFTFVTPPAPEITAVSPTNGPRLGGTSVTITGTDFSGTTGVTFDGVAATNLSVVNSTTLTATTPAHAVGAVSVVVTTPSGSNSGNTLFSYLPVAPTITSVSPTSGVNLGGTVVTLTGTDFTGASSVKFGTHEAASFNVVNSTTITAVTPATREIVVGVTVTTPKGTYTADAAYTFNPQVPTNTQLSSSQPTSAFLSPPTFIASVSTLGGAPVPGKIALYIDDVLLESKAVDSGGWVTFTPTPAQLPVGTHVIRAVYNEDLAASDYFPSAAGAIVQTVNKTPVSISLDSATLTQTYDGTPRTVTATVGTLPTIYTGSSVQVDVTYNGSATVPTNAGTYAVVATINHPTLSGSASGTLTVNKATGTFNLAASGFQYDGQPKPAVLWLNPEVPVTLTYQYYDYKISTLPLGPPSANVPVNVGNYSVFVSSPNYTFTQTIPRYQHFIGPRGVTILIGGLEAVSDGSYKAASITTIPPGLNVRVRYEKAGQPIPIVPLPYFNPPQSGSVFVEAFVDQVGYDQGRTSAIMNFAPKGAVTLSLTGPATGVSGPQTYQVTLSGRIANRSMAGTVTLLRGTEVIGTGWMPDTNQAVTSITTKSLDPSATPHVITARYEGNDFYHPATSNTVATTIAKSPLTLIPTSPLTLTYDGRGKSVSFKGPGTPPIPVEFDVTYDNSTTLPVNATTTPVQVRATIKSSDPRYFGTTTVPLTITKAPASITLGSLIQSFDGTPKSVSVITSPAGLATSVTYNGSSSPPTAAGSYSVVASVVDPNYTAQPATGTLTIAPGSVRIEITNTLQTFTPTRSSYPVTVTTTPPVAYSVTYNGVSYDVPGEKRGPYGAGTYDAVVTITQPGYSGTASATLVVKPLVTVNHPEITVYGSNINNPGIDRQGGASAVDGDFVSPSTPFPLVEGAKLRFFDSAENEVRYRFVRWKDGNPNQERLIEANRRVYTPIVRPEIKILAEAHTKINGVEQKSTVGGTVVPLTNGRTYANEREVVTFVANPNPGYVVDRWEHHDFSAAAEPVIYSLQRFSHLYGTEFEEFGAGWVPVKAYFTRGYTVTTGVNVVEAGSAKVVREDGYGYDDTGHVIGRVDPAFSNAAVPEGINTVAHATPQPGYLFNTWIVEGADLAGKAFYSPDERIYELTKSKQVFKLAPFATSMKLTAVFVREVPGPVASFTRLNTLGFGFGVIDLSVTRNPILKIANEGTGPMTNAKIVGVEISGARMKPSSNDIEELTTGGFFEFYLPTNFRPLTPEETANPDPYFIQYTEYAAAMIASKPRLTAPRTAITESNPITIGTLRPGDYQEFNNFEYFWPKANLSLGLPIGGVSFSLLQYRVTIWITADELPPTPVSFWTN